MEEDFTMEAYHADDQRSNQVSDQRVTSPPTRLRAVFNDLSSTHSSPTEVSSHFESHGEGSDYHLSSVLRHSVSRVEINLRLPLLKISGHSRLSEP